MVTRFSTWGVAIINLLHDGDRGYTSIRAEIKLRKRKKNEIGEHVNFMVAISEYKINNIASSLSSPFKRHVPNWQTTQSINTFTDVPDAAIYACQGKWPPVQFTIGCNLW